MADRSDISIHLLSIGLIFLIFAAVLVPISLWATLFVVPGLACSALGAYFAYLDLKDAQDARRVRREAQNAAQYAQRGQAASFPE